MRERPHSPTEAFRLSPQQERLESLHGGSAGPFTAWSVLSVRGAVDRDALRAALEDVAHRHEILRTNFARPSGLGFPVQTIDPARGPEIVEHDLGGTAAAEQDAALRDVVSSAVGREFDLRSGALFRAELVRLTETEHRVVLSMPALCNDWAGLGVLCEEIRCAYAARTGGESAAPDPPQYADVAEWLRGAMEERNAGPDRDLPPIGVRFPWSDGGGEGRFVPRRLDLETSASLTARIRDLAGSDDGSIRSFLLACWTVLAWRLAGRTAVCVGTLHDGRSAEELAGVPGLLARYLPLAPRLSAAASFRGTWKDIRARDERLQEGQDGDGDPPVGYPACFDCGRIPPVRSAGEAEFRILDQDARIDRFEVRLACRLRDEGISLALEYDTARVTPEAAERLGEQFLALVSGAAERPDERIGCFEILSRTEHRALVVECNDTGADLAVDGCIHHVIEDIAARHPGRIAVEHGDERCGYAELNSRANRLARHLRARGVACGSLVGIALPRSVEMVVSILAVLKAGGAYVPLDPGYPAERLHFMVEDTGMGFVITQADLRAGLPDAGFRAIVLDRERAEIDACPDGNPDVKTPPDSLVYVIYTSGSTGRPKGVMITHAGLMLSNEARRARFTGPVEKFLLLSSFSFDSSVVGIFWTLTAGGTLLLVPETVQKDLRELGEVISRSRVSHLLTLPSFYGLLLREAGPGRLESLRTVIVAGEACVRSVIARHEELLPGAGLFSEYGATETTVFSSVQDCRGAALPVAPLGEPIANATMYVLDPDLRPVPLGVTGEVYFGGPAISPGYLKRPGLTAERFVPDPFAGRAGARLYRSGDLARHLPVGALEFLGRTDNQVKIRGFRVELEEIEAAISALPGVQEAAVLALDAAAWRGDDGPAPDDGGSGGLRLASYVVRSDTNVSARDLRDSLAARVPDHLVPAEFILLDDLPRTPNGKVDREALPAPGAARPDRDGSVAEPRTEEERRLVEIWKEVLGLQQVGIHDNFFEVGGDSILSIQIVSRAGREGIALTPMQAFQHQTIAELAAAARAGGPAEAEQGEVTGPVPLTPIQHWFCGLEVPERGHWNMPLLLEMERPVRREHLQAAANAVLRHHDALRLRLVRSGAGWDQRMAAYDGPAAVELEDLGGLAEEEQTAELERRSALHQTRLDLESGPLMRLVVFDRGAAGPPLLLWVLHHLAGDIVSWRILLEDLQTALEQQERGEPIRLPAKTTSFRRWAEKLRDLAARPEALEHLGFWVEQTDGLSGAVPLDFPDGRDRNPERSLRTVRASLSAAETDALLHEVPQAYRSHIQEALLAALARTLADWKGDGTVAVEVESHGREEDLVEDVSLSRTVGWFTTSYPVRLSVADAKDPAGALRAVKNSLRAVPGRGFSYLLARYLHPDREAVRALREAPRPDVNFNYLGQFGRGLGPAQRLRLAPPELSMGPDRDPDGERTCQIDVVGWVVEDRLRMEWYFGENAHRRETIERLSESFLTALRELIAAAQAEGAAEALPAGADEFGWDEENLRDIAAAIERAKARPPRARTEVDLRSQGVDAIYPLSPMQEGLLFHALAAPDSGMYVNQCILTLRGSLDADALEHAWKRAAAWHDVLRTFFVWDGLPAPAQVVDRDASLPFERHDFAALPEDARRSRLESLLETRRRGGFDPALPPLTRIDLVRTGRDTHQLVWSFHHLLLDGWSMFTVLKQVFAKYEAQCAGREIDAPAPRPYRDYIAWLRRQDEGRAKAFWKQSLQGFTEPTRLPGGEGPGTPATTLEDAGGAEIRLSAETAEALETFCRKRRLTMSTLLHFAWAVVLSRWSGQSDVAFGTIVSGRSADLEGFESMVGLFINTLPIRARLRGEDSAADALAALQEQLVGVRQYESSRLVDIQDWSDMPAGQPLFESILLFENYRKEMPLGEMLETLQVRDVGWFEHTNYPLAVLAIPDEEFQLRLVYHRNRIAPDTAERMLDDLRTVLESVVADPGATVAGIRRARTPEQSRLLAEWSRAEVEHEAACVHEAVERQAKRAPDAVAVATAERRRTYRELDTRANRLARHLRQLGVRPEERVGVCLSRSARMPEVLLGILKAGGAYVPLDPTYPAERLAYMVRDSGARFVLGERALLDRLPDHDATPVALDADPNAEQIAGHSGDAFESPATPGNLAYVIYTSGSTGRPKGVEITHAALANLVAWHRRVYSVEPGDQATMVAAFSFDASVWETWPYLAAGATLHVADEETRASGEALLEWMAARRVTVCFLPTPLAQSLLAESVAWPPTLRAVLTGGDKLLQGPGRELPFRFVNHYGPTENAVVATASPVPVQSPLPPIGRPIDNVETYVLDTTLRRVPIGGPGELWLGGAGLARGYHGRPGLTADRFRPNPFGSGGARMYRTGDRVRWRPDGELEFLGRVDHQVKLRGFRIEPGEIEAVLVQHPRVSDGVVELREDRPGHRLLVAYTVAAGGGAAKPDELRAHLRRQLPEYMVPSAFVALPAMPLTPGGKTDRRALPAPDREAHGTGATLVAPRNDVEAQLVDVWARLLDLDRVGVNDNFFDLGANSLLMIRARGELQKILDTEIGIVELFEYPTVSALADYAGRKRAGVSATAHGTADGDDAPPRAATRDRLLRRRQRTEAAGD